MNVKLCKLLLYAHVFCICGIQKYEMGIHCACDVLRIQNKRTVLVARCVLVSEKCCAMHDVDRDRVISMYFEIYA